MKSDINVALLIKFKSVVCQKEIDCKFKKMDEVTPMLLTGNKHFELHKCVKRLTIVTGGDHSKGVLTMLLTMHIEMMDSAKRHMDELIGEIDYDKDNIEVYNLLLLSFGVVCSTAMHHFVETCFFVLVTIRLHYKNRFSVLPQKIIMI